LLRPLLSGGAKSLMRLPIGLIRMRTHARHCLGRVMTRRARSAPKSTDKNGSDIAGTYAFHNIRSPERHATTAQGRHLNAVFLKDEPD
jgi:hypothetical protein